VQQEWVFDPVTNGRLWSLQSAFFFPVEEKLNFQKGLYTIVFFPLPARRFHKCVKMM
jgi:hypothetical protein